MVHNRLTHTIKVTAVARAIATARAIRAARAAGEELGGCDPVVVQAAASAHDLGHPPFGHLGERILDRIARSTVRPGRRLRGQRADIPDHDRARRARRATGEGLNLTAAVRAAVLKYPWARLRYPQPASRAQLARHRRGGGGAGAEGTGSAKFSAYVLDVAEMREVLAAYPKIGPLRQTVECSVMDIADDIAYSLHDLDDFHRAGVLQHASVAAEFRTWIRRRDDSHGVSSVSDGVTVSGVTGSAGPSGSPGSRWSRCAAGCAAGTAGSSTTTPSGSPWAGWPPTWSTGCWRCRSTRRSPPNGRSAPSPSSWIAHLRASVEVTADPPVRAGHVVLGRQAWHEVAVLKFVHQRFVLDRPDLAMFQRGQAEALTSLVGEPGVVADRSGRRRPGAAPADRPGRAGHRGLPAGGPARNRSCWSVPPGSRRQLPRGRRPARAAAAGSSTTWPR